MQTLKQYDPQLFDAINAEVYRQQNNIELIASENFVSKAVLEAAGTPLTNKYAEGYPGKRYYGGCECVDIVENMAIDRAKALFGADHANVQPHSGSSANLAVYFSVLRPGDTIMGLSMGSGGHLTHGATVSISGDYFKSVSYDVDPTTQLLDYDAIHKMAKEHKPRMIVTGASAYSRVIDYKKFREIADDVGAYLLVDMAHVAGLIATGLHPSPVPYADFVTTTTHKTLRGPRGGMILCKAEYAKAIDKSICPGTQGGPLLHIIAAKAVCFKEASEPTFKAYQEQILQNAKTFERNFLSKGLKIVSGGTDTHLLLLDLTPLDITGKEAEKRLDTVRITVNKNGIPSDPRGPLVTSGIRVGTPAVTTRGMKEEQMDEIANLIYLTLTDYDNSRETIRARVDALCKQFPLQNV